MADPLALYPYARSGEMGFGAAPEAPLIPKKMPVLPNTADGIADVAAMTRAARVAQYGEAAVAAMEQAGSTFGGAAPAAAATAPVSAFARAMPTFASGWGMLKNAASAIAPWVAPAVETGRVVNSAMDPNQSAGETGLRAAMGAGRVAGMALGGMVPGPWPAKMAGAAAGYMLPDAAESISRWAQGGSAPIATAPATVAPAAPAAASVAPGFGASQSQVRAVDNSIMGDTTAARYPNGVPVTAQDASTIRGTGVPMMGTGGFVNNRTGAVTNLDSRETITPEDLRANELRAQGKAVYGMGNEAGGTPSPVSTYGARVGAVLNQRREAATRAEKQTHDKIALELALKGPEAAAKMAEAEQKRASTGLGARVLAQTGDPVLAAAAIHGRGVRPDATAAFPSMMPNGPVTIVDKTKGTAVDVMPQKTISKAEVRAQATKNKETYEQGLARAAKAGIKVLD